MITQETSVAAHGLEGPGRHHRPAVPRGDGAGPHRAGEDRGHQDPPRRHRDGARLGRRHRRSACRRTCGRRRPVGRRLRPVADQPDAVERAEGPPDHRQQHRRPQRRGVRAARDRRRSLPLERGLPDAEPSQADPGLRRAVGHLARPVLRQEGRPRDADPLDAAVHREHRPGRRLRLRLLLRLHRHHQLGLADRAAADDPRSARGLRSAVRRRRHPGRAGQPPPARQEHPRLHHRRGRPAAPAISARPTGPGSASTSTTCARSSGASRRWSSRTRAASRASCPARRSACPTPSPSTCG